MSLFRKEEEKINVQPKKGICFRPVTAQILITANTWLRVFECIVDGKM